MSRHYELRLRYTRRISKKRRRLEIRLSFVGTSDKFVEKQAASKVFGILSRVYRPYIELLVITKGKKFPVFVRQIKNHKQALLWLLEFGEVFCLDDVFSLFRENDW